MTDKALRLAEELEKRVAVVSDKYNDERFCVLGQDEAIEAFHETVTDHWLEIERLATDAASLIRTQQEQITELAPRAAMLSAVHGALMDAGFAMGDIGQSEVEMVRTLAESNATWERNSDEAHAQIRAQQEKVERLRGALDEIVNPLVYMQRRADADGTRLDGHMAIYVSRDPAHLQSIARVALSESSPSAEEK
jgi:uncharacterized coiled-coil protein SlyX